MAPSSSRQVLVWSLPTLAFLLSLLWYRRKRAASLRSDPGGTSQDIGSTTKPDPCVSKKEPENETVIASETQIIKPSVETEVKIESANCEIPIAEPSTVKEVLCEHNCEPVLEEVVKSTAIPSLFTAVTNSGDLDKEGAEILELQEISDVLPEIKVCEDLEKPECLNDKISDTHSFVVPIETCETDIIAEDPVNACTSLFESVEIERTAEETKIEALELVIEDTGSKLLQDIETLEDNVKILEPSVKETSAEDITTLEIAISEQLQFDEKASNKNCEVVDNLELASNSSSLLLVGDEEEVKEVCKSVDSSTTMARKTSKETPSMEKHSQEEEGNNKLSSEVNVQNSDSTSLECKLSTLDLDGNRTGGASSDVESVSTSGAVAGSYAAASKHHGTERDSANHSPADVMLASPSISSYSDEGSSDSGKGCSDVATPPSRTPASGSSLSGDVPVPSVFEFVLPQHLVGRLIGRHGCFVHQIKGKTNASILIKRHPDTPKLKICAVEAGTQADIDSALDMIRQKFPIKRYPTVTLEQVCFLPPVPTFPLVPEFLQLQLVEGVNNDVILSSLVSAGHFFLQQPTHPTFPALNRLNACMNMCYAEPTAPPLPLPTSAGVICAAPAMGGWFRAQVVATSEENETCDIKFVDYGGYLTVSTDVLRQIRSDFMTLPFQAAECYLANVVPVGGEEWSKESFAGMEELTHGQVLQAQICMYSEDGMPVVYLYAVHNGQVLLVNQELASRGLAEWVELSEA